MSRAAAFVRFIPLYFAIATALGFVDYQIRPHPDDGFMKYAPSVVAGTAEAPGRYRVLAPFAYDRLTRFTHLAPRESWIVFRWLCLFGSLLVMHWYLTTWFDGAHAAAGVVTMAALLPLTFTNGWPNPDQFTELLLFTLGCLCVARQWYAAFAVVLVLNAFNRETSAFLVLLFALHAPLTVRHAARTAALGVVWAAIFIGLRWRLGYQTYDIWQLAHNIGWLTPLPANYPPYYRIYGWFFALLIAPLACLAAIGWRTHPRFARIAAGVVAPALFATCWLISSVIETRIFTPMLPLLLPAALHGALRPAR